jgi:methionine synthase II (cobalamin-independent)
MNHWAGFPLTFDAQESITTADYNDVFVGGGINRFPEYFATRTGFAGVGPSQRQVFCTGPLKYIGQAAVQTDIQNFKAALQGVQVEEAFLPAVAPGTIEHWLRNDYYPSDEAYLHAIADAMREEYKAITGAGFLLQIDDPDLPDAWNIHTDMSVPEYRKFAELRVDALTHALREIPWERVRLHVCWGSYHDGKPVAKVIDFGVAKAIHQPLTDRTIYTNFAQMIGTPLYMSPEQAEMSGLDIDTRSDIYSLGVLLY